MERTLEGHDCESCKKKEAKGETLSTNEDEHDYVKF